MVTVVPAGTLHLEAAGPWLALQRMSLLVTEVTGLLLLGSLAQVDWWVGVSVVEGMGLEGTYLVYSVDPEVLECCVGSNMGCKGRYAG